MEVNGPMQIEIDTEILETIFTHAARAARLAGYLDDPIADDGTSIIPDWRPAAGARAASATAAVGVAVACAAW